MLIYFIIFILLIFILKKILFKYYHKDLYYLYLKHISKPYAIHQGKYFIENFDNIIKPFYVGNIKIKKKK